jgi:hypothetical protein
VKDEVAVAFSKLNVVPAALELVVDGLQREAHTAQLKESCPARGQLGSLLAATAAKAFCFAFVCWMAIIRPLLPADIQFLGQESMLCQLQSSLGGELSIVAPAVGHDLLLLR